MQASRTGVNCLAAVLCAAAVMAHAADYYWDGEGAANTWDDPVNWVGNSGYPLGVDDTAYFSGTNRPVVDLNGDRVVKSVIFTNAATGFTLTGNTLTLAPGGMIASFVAGYSWTLSSAMNLQGDATFLFTPSGARNFLYLNGAITGSNTVTLAGTGADGSWVVVNGNNTGFTGTMVLSSGSIQMGNVNAFGTHPTPAEIRPGVLFRNPANSTKPLRATGDFSMSWSFTYSGPIELVSNATVSVQTGGGNACRLLGAITGTGNVYLEKNGEMGGTAANTYTGVTTIAGTSVILSKTAGLDAVPGPLLIGSAGTSGRVQLSHADQINDASTAYLINTASRSGTLALNGCNETLGGLVTTGGVAGTACVENTHATTPATLTINNSADGAFAGSFRDGGAAALYVTKRGAGAFYMNGMATNTGSWTIEGGTLGGTGTIAAAATVTTAALAPGASIGTLTFGTNVALGSDTELSFELGAPGGAGASDRVAVGGNLILDGTVNVTAYPGFSNAVENASWTLITCGGTLTDNGLALGSLPVCYTYAIETGVGGQVNLKVTGVTQAPEQPANPSPANGATNVDVIGSLDWDDTALAGGYQVYFWASSGSKPGAPSAELSGNGSSQWDPPGYLAPLTSYSWQIVATNSMGASTGAVWTFTTAPTEPDAPTTPVPADGAVGVRVDTALDWANATRATGYQVVLWLATDSEPATPTAATTSSVWTPPSQLNSGVTYNWRVVSTNGFGSATGTVWTFTTMAGGSYVWDGGGGTDSRWDTLANWVGDAGYPYSLTDTALIRTNPTPVHINMNGSQSLASLTISPISEAGFSITNGSLTLAAGGFIRLALTGTTGPNNQSWNVATALSLPGDAVIQSTTAGGYGRNLNVSGPISGSNTLYCSAVTGTAPGYWGVIVSGNNTNFSGTAVITNGPVQMSHANAFGTNSMPIELRGGNLAFSISPSKPVRVTGTAKITATGNSTYTGTLTLTNNPTLTLDSFNGANSRTLTLNGPITGTGNLAVFSSGAVVTFGGASANTFTGGVTITRDTLVLNKTPGVDAIPSLVTIGDGDAAQHVLRLANNHQINDGAIVQFGASSSDPTYSSFRLNGYSETVQGLQSVSNGYGTVENYSGTTASTLTLSTLGTNVFSGVVRNGSTGVLSVAISGTGVQAFNGTASNTGGWTVNGGTLGGTGTIASVVTVNGGAIGPGMSAGTLNVASSLVLGTGATLAFELGNPDYPEASDRIAGVTDLTLDGTLNVRNLSGYGTARVGDSWPLLSYSGTLTNNGLDLGSLPAGYTYQVDTGTPGLVSLKITDMGLPGQPAYPQPADGASGVPGTTLLRWVGAATESYLVYFWPASEAQPATPAAVTPDDSFDPPGELAAETQYRWQIVASNSLGTTTGAVWSFTTRMLDFVWDGGDASDSNWTSPSNWVADSGYPHILEDRAVLTGTNRTLVSLNGDTALTRLSFTNTPAGFTITNNTLTLADGGSVWDYNPYPGPLDVVGSTVLLLGNATFGSLNGSGVNNLGWLQFNGSVGGAGTLTLSGPATGRISLNANNAALTGPIVCSVGTVRIAAGGFGSSLAGTTFTTGTWVNVVSSAEPFTIAGDTAFQCWGSSPALSGPVSVLTNATLTLNSGGGNPWTLSGPIGGAGSVHATSGGATDGTPTLSGTNTFTGRLTVGSRVILQGTLNTADIVIEAGGQLRGAAPWTRSLPFREGQRISNGGTLDVTWLQFDTTRLRPSRNETVLVDSSAGTVLGLPDPLDSLLTPQSQTLGWKLTNTGTQITASVPALSGTTLIIR